MPVSATAVLSGNLSIYIEILSFIDFVKIKISILNLAKQPLVKLFVNSTRNESVQHLLTAPNTLLSTEM